MRSPNVNRVLLGSIPLEKDLKRYFVKKWDRLIEHNGPLYAVEIFKSLRTILIQYRADPSRVQHTELYLSKLPIRKNGWARKLLLYTDSHPHLVLNFLKLFTSFSEPLVTPDEAATEMHENLSALDVNVDVPWFLDAWLNHFVENDRPLSKSSYQIIQDFARRSPLWQNLPRAVKFWFASNGERIIWEYAKHHSYDQYRSYFFTWHSRFRKVVLSEDESLHHMSEIIPQPEAYADFVGEAFKGHLDTKVGISGSSEQADKDLLQFALWAKANGVGGRGFSRCVLDLDDLNFMMQPLDRRTLTSIINPAVRDGFITSAEFQHDPLKYVGEIHHIPKKGTVVRRSIAVPNRYVQMALAPGYRFLERFVRRLKSTDATFNQDAFDVRIQNRVNNPNLYVGSVDLSKATDNLPFSWGDRILSALPEANAVIDQSLHLFRKISRSPWANGPHLSRWTVGQPLGTLPSFMLLSLTHNLYLESLSLSQGLSHSPYRVLGDDVVIFNKKVRKKYISDMSNRRIPLSLHKSYEGNLTEFAGKTYIRNMRNFYTPDHQALTWNSLFDWQRSAGIHIPYDKLPKDFKRRIERMTGETHPLPPGVSGRAAYELALRSYVFVRGSAIVNDDRFIDTFWYHLEDPDPPSESELFSGVVRVGGHPVLLGDVEFAHKNGYFMKYRKVLPDWFERKFRPVETDKVVLTALKALKTVKQGDLETSQ